MTNQRHIQKLFGAIPQANENGCNIKYYVRWAVSTRYDRPSLASHLRACRNFERVSYDISTGIEINDLAARILWRMSS
jgi:hypothetical protein